MKQFEAGAAKIDITPPVGTELAGYTPRVERTNRSTGIHDPIWIRALALRSNGRCAFVLVMDLLGIELPVARRIRSLIAEAIPVVPDSILISCTHNHSGPSILDGHEKHILVDQDWRESAIKAAVRVAVTAFGKMKPAQFGVAKTEVHGVGANRKVWLDDGSLFHYSGLYARVPPEGRTVVKEGVVDPELSVLCVKDSAGKIIAVLINYACHPWLYNGNRVSSEVSGACVELVEVALRQDHSDVVALFTPGTGSNIITLQNQRPMPSGLPERERWFSSERERLGGILARATLEAMGEMRELTIPESVTSAVRKIVSPVYDRELDAVLLEHGNLPPTNLVMETEVQVLKIGQVVLVGLPSEVYVEIGLEIKARSRYGDTFVISQSNDYFADIITHDAVEEGCCPELQWTRVHPDIRGQIITFLEAQQILD